uniref:PH domain-containing protein n=2 Tax=Clastoptera arizonana TaxID=38151 RepID=A0A1B6DHZ6_9HEMI
MLVEPGSGAPSLLDSPTLQRVERARLRQESTAGSVSPYCPSLASDREMHHAIKKGLLWQQRERLFSRWKERYFILTRDYLHCFKRSSGADRITEMGQFIFKVKLVEVESVEWINKKSYSTVGLTLQSRESRVLLRAPIGLEDWFELLEDCMLASKERRRALRKLHNPLWQGDDDASSLDWFINRGTLNKDQHNLSDSVPDLEQRQNRNGRDEEELWRRPPGSALEQRLSLLTDIDINSCSSQLETPPPSVPATFRGRPYPYRLNNDIFFMTSVTNSELQSMTKYTNGSITPSYCNSRSGYTQGGSFRSNHLFSPVKTPERLTSTNSQIKYRDRSQSDVLNWKSRTADLKNRRSLLDASHV